MEHLPFADHAFSKACCLNAFHHVPDTGQALREIKRVLKPDGVAFFSEPGVGHASRPTSMAASRNYGVLESEIRIEPFMTACRDAGFADVRLHPPANVMPLFELDARQWRRWRQFTASKRPVRALEKMWKALLEVAGLGKTGVLFEEAFAIRLLRELQSLITEHPVITAHRAAFVKPTATIDAAAIEVMSCPAQAGAGAPVSLRLRIANAGSTRWDSSPAAGHVRVGVQLLAEDGRIIDRDYSRRAFPAALDPGGRCEMTIETMAPPEAGVYQLKIDLVREGVTWFELAGSPPALVPLIVA